MNRLGFLAAGTAYTLAAMLLGFWLGTKATRTVYVTAPSSAVITGTCISLMDADGKISSAAVPCRPKDCSDPATMELLFIPGQGFDCKPKSP